MKRRMLSERNLVVVLFVMVFVIFSLAQEDTKKIEKMYKQFTPATATSLNNNDMPEIKAKQKENKDILPAVDYR